MEEGDMTRTFFTADTHFGHGRIIQYCQRPFSDARSQDEAILERFNEVLRPGDVLYHLGDVSWSSFPIKEQFLRRLNTREVHLILGNHDNRKVGEYLAMGFRSVQTYKEVRMDVVRGTMDKPGSSTPVSLFHYPQRSWNHKGGGGIALYGHCHGSLEPGLDRSMDVGVDTHNFYPWAWEEIREIMKGRPVFSSRAETDKEFLSGMGQAIGQAIADGTHVRDIGDQKCLD